jgi:ribosomal 50S subunit-recycling heat shock protein
MGDVVEIQLGSSMTRVEVTSTAEHVSKTESKEMYIIK